jgi:putative membrane protein
MKKLLMIYLKGVAMGASDVVPGVSGGTIAFITGIYERLINAIKSINGSNLKLFFTGHIKECWKNIDGNFLVCLIAGIATSFLSLAKLITWLIATYPTFVWAFFFGLIIASTLFIGKKVKWDWKTVLAFLLFAIISFFITSPGNAPLNQNNALWYIFLCGAVAICAMILPGISGSFILLLLGSYFYMMDALSTLQFTVILVFMAGALIGILSFANLLSWLFKHFEMMTLAALTGFMFGSLNKVWPWKETLTTYLDKHGVKTPLTQRNILPAMDGSLVIALLLIAVGIILVIGLEKVADRKNKAAA